MLLVQTKCGHLSNARHLTLRVQTRHSLLNGNSLLRIAEHRKSLLIKAIRVPIVYLKTNKALAVSS